LADKEKLKKEYARKLKYIINEGYPFSFIAEVVGVTTRAVRHWEDTARCPSKEYRELIDQLCRQVVRKKKEKEKEEPLKKMGYTPTNMADEFK